MKTVCTRCGSDEVYVEKPESEKIPQTQTMDEFKNNVHKPVNLTYKLTTLRCKKCGYNVSY